MKKILLSLAMVAVALSANATDHLFTRLTAEQLSAVTTSKKIAIECTQSPNGKAGAAQGNFMTFYNGTTSRTNLQSLTTNTMVPGSIVFEWVPSGEEGKFFIKKASEEKYLTITNKSTFCDSKDDANIAKFEAKSASETVWDASQNSYYTDEDDQQYITRLALGANYLNMNNGNYAAGTGCWSAQNVLDLTGYYKLTIVQKQNGQDDVNEVYYVKEGATAVAPAKAGFIAKYTPVIKDNTDTQTMEVTYVAGHTLSVGESGWATLVLGTNAIIPENVKCYVVKEINGEGSKAILTAVTGTIAANNAVLVNAVEGSYDFEFTTAEATAVEGNLLNGTLTAQAVTPATGATCYVLSKPEDKEIGFYQVELTEGAFQSAANKAYLSIVGEAGEARSLTFAFGTETAIESIQGAESANAVVYDLAGRRVQGAQKGLYIVNGKKVIK